MKNYFVLAVLIGFTSNLLMAQNKISGQIHNNTKEADYLVEINGKNIGYQDQLYKDNYNEFTFYDVPNGQYTISIYPEGYYYYDTTFTINNQDLNFDVYLIENPDTFELYQNDYFYDPVNFTFGFDFLSYSAGGDKDLFKPGFSVDYAIELRFPLSRKMQLGIRWDFIKLSWMNMKDDSVSLSATFDKQRYFEVSTALAVYLRYSFSKEVSYNNRGAFCDLGFGYTLPYLFEYRNYQENDTYTAMQHIRKFNEIGGFMRIGYDLIALKAAYRITDIMKDDLPEPPKMTLGIQLMIP